MKTKRDRSRVAGIAAFILAIIINPMLTMCACGHMEWESVPGNMIAFALAWRALLAGKDKRVLTRMIIALACVVSTFMFVKIGADILWYGHNPLLK